MMVLTAGGMRGGGWVRGRAASSTLGPAAMGLGKDKRVVGIWSEKPKPEKKKKKKLGEIRGEKKMKGGKSGLGEFGVGG